MVANIHICYDYYLGARKYQEIGRILTDHEDRAGHEDTVGTEIGATIHLYLYCIC